MGIPADCRQHQLGEGVPGSVPPRHDSVIWINSLVQVLSYVLQARSSLPEASGTGERLEEEPACARRTPSNLSQRSPTTAKLLVSPNTGVHVHRAAAGYVESIPATVMPCIATTLRKGEYPPDMETRPVYQVHRFDPIWGFVTETRIVGTGPSAA